MKKTLSFLNELKENNNKPWFTAHKEDFEAAKAEMKELAKDLMGMMLTHDNVDTKPKLFRIYRDVRFSKDKTPYKKSMSGSMTRNTAALRGGYYFHVEPGGSFLGGGFWAPSTKDLLHLRQQIQLDPQPLRAVIAAPEFKSYFGEMGGEQLKTSPKGFDKEDPNIDLLRYKAFIVSKKFTDEEVLQKDFAEKLNQGFANMRPFFDVMSEFLTTNLNGESLI